MSNLTLLYGDNNSGKTTFLRALNLLKATFSQPNGTNLVVPSHPYNLGSEKTLCWAGADHERNNKIKFRINTIDESKSLACQMELEYELQTVPLAEDQEPGPQEQESRYVLQSVDLLDEEGQSIVYLRNDSPDHGNFFQLTPPSYHDEENRWISREFLKKTVEKINSNNTNEYLARLSKFRSVKNPTRREAKDFIRDRFFCEDGNQWSLDEKVTFLERIICFRNRSFGECTERELTGVEISSFSARASKVVVDPHELSEHDIVFDDDDAGQGIAAADWLQARSNEFRSLDVPEEFDSWHFQKICASTFRETILNFAPFVSNSINKISSRLRGIDFAVPQRGVIKRYFELSDPQSNYGDLADNHGKNRKAYSVVNDALRDFGFDFKVSLEKGLDNQVGQVLLRYSSPERKINLADAGYGIAQLINALILISGGSCSAFEEPEVHLHKKLQKKFIDLLIRQTKDGSKQFILDTHSEISTYTLLNRIAKTTEGKLEEGEAPLSQNELQFLQVEYLPDEKRSRVNKINVARYGTFSPPWPGGFSNED